MAGPRFLVQRYLPGDERPKGPSWGGQLFNLGSLDLNYEITPLKYAVGMKGENPVFGEGVTRVEVDDEAAGPFIVLSQCSDEYGEQKIRVNLDELKVVLGVAVRLINRYPKELRDYELELN